jgi:hypothetical protein
MVMLKHTLIILILALTQFGCGYEYGEGKWPYEVISMSDKGQQEGERIKRELLQLEDIKVGDGPVAAWGRKISADIVVRYDDGTLMYQGPVFSYIGFADDVGIHNSIYDSRLLSSAQEGIKLGLNGMVVGGKRRITVNRSLVCTNLKIDADPKAACLLIGRDLQGRQTGVRKEKLIVEATLTESCLPVMLKVFEVQPGHYVINRVVGCRDSETPKLDPALPTWHFY